MSEAADSQLKTAPFAWRRFLVQGVVLMGLWLLLSGQYDAFHIALGVLSVGLVIGINRHLPPVVCRDDPPEARLRLWRLALYLPWLFLEMVLSSLHVARVVLSPRPPLSPRMVRFKSRQPGDFARVILGNSITLTPGTLTITIEGDEYLVHALTPTTASGLLSGTMQTKVARLFLDEPADMVTESSADPPLSSTP
ncbi:MAG TPA: Na+/H+ antiporter subunit E [Methylomirabilota bacterium]|nr:Na+/H+ antiporter subunit E [Methylomirabilota bacterium]